jgi:hypothetical protein
MISPKLLERRLASVAKRSSVAVARALRGGSGTMSEIKDHIRLTGERFWYGGNLQGIRVLPVLDSLEPRNVAVWIIGRWAYGLTNLPTKRASL